MGEPMNETRPADIQQPIKPVGFWCDHEDEPDDARTHEGWEWTDDGQVWTHQPNVLNAQHGRLRDGEKRCPRAVPVYAVDAPTLLAERANAYDALTKQGRSAADVSGNLEDGINWERLAHSAEVTGLVEELALVRGERDQLAGQVERVREEITATRAHATEHEDIAANAGRGSPVRARRELAIAEELAARADRFERALNGGDGS